MATIPAWSTEAKERAKEKHRYLFKLELNGRYTQSGPAPGTTIGVAADVENDGLAYALMGLVQVLTFGPGTVPTEMRKETLEGMVQLIEMMMLETQAEPTRLTETLEMLRETFGVPTPTSTP